jgi:hypothetical protein
MASGGGADIIFCFIGRGRPQIQFLIFCLQMCVEIQMYFLEDVDFPTAQYFG